MLSRNEPPLERCVTTSELAERREINLNNLVKLKGPEAKAQTYAKKGTY